ncbi:hypothetical protein COR50_02160 [Chitinophaga caeni]|uniref:Uncharacterized protein n=1 Tax=Chitinophaga caeni TaxID=2029983 RepID=A0A291QQ54_9BACT|nr:hypothetical protein [Chitinophaga caeni]ATL46061.1 hypothetical protein COR50_02160 [Chitinophaga caeni]
MNLETLLEELATEFPEMKFRIGKRLFTPCIIAHQTNYYGADIFVKKKYIIVEASIPDMSTRIILGGGALILKAKKEFHIPAHLIFHYLSKKYEDVKLRQ